MNEVAVSALPVSEFFTLQQLAEGVYAAISKEGTGSWSNAGIVDLGDSTLIFDTFATTRAADDLRAAAEQLTGRKAAYVINSHDHLDHVRGNQVFAGATVISTAITRETVAARQPQLVEMVKQHGEAHLAAMQKEIEQEQNPAKRRELEVLLGEFTAIGSDIDKLVLTLPTVTFEDQLVLYGSRRRVEVITYGGGHSASDAFLYLPDEKISFLADLMHIGYHADFRKGNVEEWVRILDEMQALDIDTVVSGHGTVGTAEDLVKMRQYLVDLQQLAADWVKGGGTADDVQDIAMPEAYASLGVPSVFYGNMKVLLQKQG
jgi:cyclase